MKRFIPDVKNNVCVVDENGITPFIRCSDVEECFYYCDRLNKVEKHDRMVNNRNNSAGSRARDCS